MLYRRIAERKPVREGYLDYLLELGEVTRAEADEIAESRRALLEQNLAESRLAPPVLQVPDGALIVDGQSCIGGPEPADDTVTGVDRPTLPALLTAQTQLPADFHPHPNSSAGWTLAGTWRRGEQAAGLGRRRIAGVCLPVGRRPAGAPERPGRGRGTFSHRHAVFHDYEGRPSLHAVAASRGRTSAG